MHRKNTRKCGCDEPDDDSRVNQNVCQFDRVGTVQTDMTRRLMQSSSLFYQLGIACCSVSVLYFTAAVRFTLSIVRGYDVLVNEDKTRSFICLRVKGGRHLVLQLIRKVDPVMRKFKQPLYYEVSRCPHSGLILDLSTPCPLRGGITARAFGLANAIASSCCNAMFQCMIAGRHAS